MNKEEQIDEMSNQIKYTTGCYSSNALMCAEILYDMGYRKRNTSHWREIRNAYGELEGWIHTECGREVKRKDNYCTHCGAKMDGGDGE